MEGRCDERKARGKFDTIVWEKKLATKKKRKINTPWPETAADQSISTQQPTKNRCLQRRGVWGGGEASRGHAGEA